MATKDTASVQQMHDWYMADGRRSLASVAREFDVPEEDLRTAFAGIGLALKSAQPLRGAAAKNKAKAQATQNGESAQRPERPDVGDLMVMPDEGATLVIERMLNLLDHEIGVLQEARDALAAVLGEGR